MEKVDTMKKVGLLEARIEELRSRRNDLRKSMDDIKSEMTSLVAEEEEIHSEIDKIKRNGVHRFLGQYAIVEDNWRGSYYIYITSIATEYNDCFASFSGPHFSMNVKGGVRCDTEHESARSNGVVFVEDQDQVTVITRDEFLSAFESFQDSVKDSIIKSLDAIPLRKTETEYVYNEIPVEVFED